ncbi:MAG: alpha-glucan family phosphorylase, partial [Mucispirillum sp.]|nr:alpha-glucan family phosphorylase [Mucispirillum sp.]
IHESVQLYSGGLGILSGDHCKSTSDMGIPLVAVGLLYRNGYFHQHISSDGWQQERYPYNEFFMMPLTKATDSNGRDIILDMKIGERNVKIRVWKLRVGLMDIILLDTDLPENDPDDRIITGKLYDGDSNMRIRQEIVLGVAGCRALAACGLKPTVYHLNEGHPAFVSIERLKMLIEDGVDPRLAIEIVRKSTLFTTHTPVPAGFDVFSVDQIKRYLSGLYEPVGINLNMLMSFGRKDRGNPNEPFNMAVAGINLSTYRNGVAKLHGEVSREMFHSMWSQAVLSQVPIGHVTNGVHLPTFMSSDMKNILSRYVSEDWATKPYHFDIWERVHNIPDSVLFDMKRNQRERLVSFIRRTIKETIKKSGGSAKELLEAEDILNPNVLTIGFARRFATYKRAYLLFMDEERLKSLFRDPERSIQFVIAGKAHPKDNEGKEIIKKIIHIARKPEFRNHIVFIEDYDIEVARYMTRGVDIWLNNPRRPMEASGTSGMKAAANGALNLSILDGWWDEGFNGKNGWAIGSGEEYPDSGYQDYVESMEIYNTLEKEIIPLFYAKDKSGMPREWLGMIKENLRTVPSFFNTSRMLMDYANQYYVPLHKLQKEFNANNYEEAKKYIDWYNKVLDKWDGVAFLGTDVEAPKGFIPNEKVKFNANLNINGTDAEYLGVFAVVEYDGVSGNLQNPEFIRLKCDKNDAGECTFSANYVLSRAGKFKVGFLVTPFHKFLKNPFELNKAKWA